MYVRIFHLKLKILSSFTHPKSCMIYFAKCPCPYIYNEGGLRLLSSKNEKTNKSSCLMMKLDSFCPHHSIHMITELYLNYSFNVTYHQRLFNHQSFLHRKASVIPVNGHWNYIICNITYCQEVALRGRLSFTDTNQSAKFDYNEKLDNASKMCA